MQIRPTQATVFGLIRSGITSNTAKLVRAQEQTSSGRRILRPSDDAAGTSVAMSLRRQIGNLEAFVSATDNSRPQVEQAAVPPGQHADQGADGSRERDHHQRDAERQPRADQHARE